MDKFRERLKELRIEKGLTQDQLAQETGISRSAIGFWENGKKIPLASVIVVLAKYFNVSTDYLLGVVD